MSLVAYGFSALGFQSVGGMRIYTLAGAPAASGYIWREHRIRRGRR